MDFPFKKSFFVVLLLGCAGIYLARCSVKPHTTPTAPNVLAPTETERLILGPHSFTIVTPTKTTKQYVPDSGGVTISVHKNGEVTTHVKEAGFGFRPGLGVVFADQMRLSLDTQVGYYGRFGLHIGCGLRDRPLFLGLVGASYRLDQLRLQNTSLFIGKTLGNPAWFVGMRVEL